MENTKGKVGLSRIYDDIRTGRFGDVTNENGLYRVVEQFPLVGFDLVKLRTQQ